MDALDRWRQGWQGTGRVVVTGRFGIGDETRAVLEEAGLEIVLTQLRDERGALIEAAADAEVLISGGAPMGADVFAGLKRARFVLRPYVGYDDIDVDAATEHGILVANVPDTFVQEVAEHAMMLILAVIRKTRQMDRLVRSGEWA